MEYKKTILGALVGLTFTASVSAGPFDVTENEYNLGISYSNNFYDHRYDFSADMYISDAIFAHIKGVESYSEEMDDWEFFRELQENYDYAEQLNLNTTDNVAYAVVWEIDFKIEVDGRSHRFYSGQMISGSDWDNNGKLDVLEGHPGISHSVSVVQPK